jgi:hypothetical protein
MTDQFTSEIGQAHIESIQLELEERAEWQSASLSDEFCPACGHPLERRERECQRCRRPRCVGCGS